MLLRFLAEESYGILAPLGTSTQSFLKLSGIWSWMAVSYEPLSEPTCQPKYLGVQGVAR